MRGGNIYEKYYEIILYKEGDVYLFEDICRDNGYQYAYIKHDSDFKEDGSLKKVHWHFLIKFEREKSINKVAKQFMLKPNEIEWKADWNLSIQYLIHKNDSAKAQYNIEDITTNVPDIYARIYPAQKSKDAKENELKDMQVILAFMSEFPKASVYELLQFCIDNGVYATFRRSYHILKDMRLESRGKAEYYGMTLNKDDFTQIENSHNEEMA